MIARDTETAAAWTVLNVWTAAGLEPWTSTPRRFATETAARTAAADCYLAAGLAVGQAIVVRDPDGVAVCRLAK